MRENAWVMHASQVASLQLRLMDLGVTAASWVAGVDALVGIPTREHKGLDVLLPLTALQAGVSCWSDEGFELAYTWLESRWITGVPPAVG
jgi:hypothetical protein